MRLRKPFPDFDVGDQKYTRGSSGGESGGEAIGRLGIGIGASRNTRPKVAVRRESWTISGGQRTHESLGSATKRIQEDAPLLRPCGPGSISETPDQ